MRHPQRLEYLCLAVTVLVMFSLTEMLPMLLTRQGWPTPVRLLLTPLAAAAGSLGFYRLLLTAAMLLADRVQRLKRLVLGPAFVEGTWVGLAEPSVGEFAIVIDRISQSWDAIEINGIGYLPNGFKHSHWRSHSVVLDLAKGRMDYFYETTPIYGGAHFQGVTSFEMIRSARTQAPSALSGSYNEPGPVQHTPITQWKVGHSLLPDAAAAREFLRLLRKRTVQLPHNHIDRATAALRALAEA